MTLNRISVSCCFIALVFGTLVTTSCRKSHDHAKQVTLNEKQLNVPGLSPDQKKVSDARLDWNMEGTLDAYNKIGIRDPKWDFPAREALKLWSQVRAYGEDVDGYPTVLQAYLKRAMDAGCTDPLIGYLNVRMNIDKQGVTVQDLAQAYYGSSVAMEQSGYDAFRKFAVAARAESAFNKLKDEQAKGSLAVATKHFKDFVSDSQVPAPEVANAFVTYLGMIKHWDDEKTRFDAVESILMKNWGGEGFSYAVRGEFYIDYAWHGRTGQVDLRA